MTPKFSLADMLGKKQYTCTAVIQTADVQLLLKKIHQTVHTLQNVDPALPITKSLDPLQDPDWPPDRPFRLPNNQKKIPSADKAVSNMRWNIANGKIALVQSDVAADSTQEIELLEKLAEKNLPDKAQSEQLFASLKETVKANPNVTSKGVFKEHFDKPVTIVSEEGKKSSG